MKETHDINVALDCGYFERAGEEGDILQEVIGLQRYRSEPHQKAEAEEGVAMCPM